MGTSRLPLAALTALGILALAPASSAQDWNRRAESITFSGSTVNVIWYVEAIMLADASDMSTLVTLEVNGMPVPGSPHLVTVTNIGTITLPCGVTCTDIPCNIWTINAFNNNGSCSKQRNVCYCVCVVPDPFAGLALTPGDIVKASLAPAPGALGEIDTSDDSVTVVYHPGGGGGVPAMGAGELIATALLLVGLGSVVLLRRGA